jgi:hypothetical protein
MRARIANLRLRVPAMDMRSAKALAMEVSSKLALRVHDLSGLPAQETTRMRMAAPRSMAKGTLADSIVDRIASRGKGGGRE